MKRFFSSKLCIALVILAIFISGQLLGASAIKHYFIESKIEELQPQLTLIRDKVANGEKIKWNDDYLVKAYDEQGNEFEIYRDQALSHTPSSGTSMEKVLSAFLPDILSGNRIAEIKEIPGFATEAIIVGQPLLQNNEITGGMFLLKPARAYKAALHGFYLVFFVTLAIGTIIILLFLTLFVREKNQLEQMRKDYIANISHELKTPLSSIKALTETLSDHVIRDPAKIDSYYRIILKESAHLEKLISDLLELSKLQSKKMDFPKSVVDTNQLVERATESFSVLAEDMDLHFQITERAQNLPPTYSNEDRLIQVLTILLDNAFKFSPENGRITLDAKTTNKKVDIMISDNGPGISKEFLNHIFERFNMEDLSHQSVGSGLGLSIAREIMDQLGEKINVQSQLGEGTTCTITIKRR